MAAWASPYTESKSRSKRNFGSSTTATRRTSPAFNCTNRIVFSPRLLNDLELLDSLFVDGQAKTGQVIIQVDKSVLGAWLAIEDVPEELIAHLHIHRWKVLRHGRIEAGHHYVVVVHLACMGNDRDGKRLCHSRDLSCLADAAHAVGIDLDIVDGACFQHVAHAIGSELVLTACDRHSAV